VRPRALPERKPTPGEIILAGPEGFFAHLEALPLWDRLHAVVCATKTPEVEHRVAELAEIALSHSATPERRAWAHGELARLQTFVMPSDAPEVEATVARVEGESSVKVGDTVKVPSPVWVEIVRCPECRAEARLDGCVPHTAWCRSTWWRPAQTMLLGYNGARYGGDAGRLALIAETGARTMYEYKRTYVSGRHPHPNTLKHHYAAEARAAGYDGSRGRSMFDYILALIAER
jgi:hypothetical protein